MKFLKRCNGFRSCAPEFSQAARDVFLGLSGRGRLEFYRLVENDSIAALTAGPFEYGSRFSDDDTVWRRITSAATEDEFLAAPLDWVLDALRDCASADHWYTHEKEW